MIIVWDEPKRLQNLVKHGLDFARLDLAFFVNARIRAAKSGRAIAIGELDGRVFVVVVYLPLGQEALSIISMRPGKERTMSVKYSSKRPLTDAEEVEIQAMIASDPDNPELTEDELKELRPFREVFPDLADAIDRKLGRPKSESPKKAISIRLDQEVIARFKAGGDGWQSRMNEALRKAVGL